MIGRFPAAALAVALAVAFAVALAGCQVAPSQAPIEMLDSRVAAGAPTTCGNLRLSEVRCSLITLRAAKNLEDARPDAEVASQQFHEAAEPAGGQSPIPRSQVVAAVVVFTLTDGSRVGVPVLCPADPSGSDQACDPRVN